MAETESKVGLFLVSEGNPHQRETAREAEAAARRHGLALQVFFADNLSTQQSQDVVRFLHDNSGKRLCVIIMPVADIDSATGAVADHPVHKLARRVAARGVGWIVLNRDAEAQVAALQREFPAPPIGMVSPDQKEFGRVQGRQFKALLPQGGQVLYVLGNPYVTSSRDRREGMREEAAGAGFTFHEVDGLWLADRAREAVSKWLSRASQRDTWPDLVGCQNDEMALGARESLVHAAADFHRPALGRIPVTGGDGLPERGQKWVVEKKLAATVVMPPTAGPAVDYLAAAWATGRPMPLKTIVPVTAYPPLGQLTPAKA